MYHCNQCGIAYLTLSGMRACCSPVQSVVPTPDAADTTDRAMDGEVLDVPTIVDRINSMRDTMECTDVEYVDDNQMQEWCEELTSIAEALTAVANKTV